MLEGEPTLVPFCTSDDAIVSSRLSLVSKRHPGSQCYFYRNRDDDNCVSQLFPGLSSAAVMSQLQSNVLSIGLPIKPSEIPSEDEILTFAREILAASANWKQSRSYKKFIKTSTYSPSAKNGNAAARWACRVSEHTREEGTFDDFWNGLGTNKAENEMQ